MRPIKKIIVHCSDSEHGTVDSIRQFHMALPPEGRGWSDIGYHFVITRDGAIHNGRPSDNAGAHCEGQNFDSLGVCLIGKNGWFALRQFMSLRLLIAKLREIHGIKADQIFCHYEFDRHGKTCPDINKDDLLKFLNL